MKQLLVTLVYMILVAIIGALQMYGRLTDIQAITLFVVIFIVPLAIKLLLLPRKN